MLNPLDYLNDLKLLPLSPAAFALLSQLQAPARLIAHSVIVHDVGLQLMSGLSTRWPTLQIESDSVALGAALHDIGKITYPEELTQPGHQHEAAGYALLLAAGLSPNTARFCITHAMLDPKTLEDGLVALADTCWKGKRAIELEQQIINHISVQFPEEPWETLLFVDQLIEHIAADADVRLTWQAQFSPL